MSHRGNNVMDDLDWQLDCGGIRQRGARLLASAQWTDCSFLLGPHRVPARAHKLLLAIASPVFQAMFYGPLDEGSAPIPVPDIQPDVFQNLLKYIYSDKIDFANYVTAIKLYCAAQKYKLQHLLKECTSYLSYIVAPQNACCIYEFANFIGDQKLQYKSLKVIQKNTIMALKNISFENLALGTVIDIFSMDDLTIYSELDLLAAAERYVIGWRKRADDQLKKQMLFDIRMEVNICRDVLQDIKSENESVSDKAVDVESNGFNKAKCVANGVVENHDGEMLCQTHSNDRMSEKNKNTVATKKTTSSKKPPTYLDTEKELDSAQSEATFRFTVHNFSKLRGKVSSPTCYIRNLPWKLAVRPYYNQGQKSLAIFLHCNSGSKSISWSCEARAEVRVISPDNDTELLFGVIEHLFSRRTSIRGFPYYKTWSDIQGYLKNGSITLEVYISAEAPQGLSWDSNHRASDFELKDVSIQAMVRPIRFLTLPAKALAEYNPETSLLSEHDLLAFMMNISSEKTHIPLPEGFSTIRRPRNCTHFPTYQ